MTFTCLRNCDLDSVPAFCSIVGRCCRIQTLVYAHKPCSRRKQDPELLRFIDIECYCWSTVLADFTPMINSGMVFCDRHFGGINYPKVRPIFSISGFWCRSLLPSSYRWLCNQNWYTD